MMQAAVPAPHNAGGWNPGLAPFLNPLPVHDGYAAVTDFTDPEIDDQVQTLLASIVHHLAAKGKKGIYPYTFVFRGQKKETTGLWELSISEKCWGIMRVMEDVRTSAESKPYIVNHLDEELEDACDFAWAGVRRWLKEVFNQIADSRMCGGWSNDNRIQMLQMSVSRIGPMISNSNNQHQGKSHAATTKQSTQPTEKGGPPCKDFNVGTCSLPGWIP